MAVYSLTTEPTTCALLCGDAELIVEFADVLTLKNINFRILPNFDEVADFFDGGTFDAELMDISNMKYGKYMHLVVADPAQAGVEITHAVYVSMSSLDSQGVTLDRLSLIAQGKPLIVIPYTTTATDIGQYLDCDDSVVGVGLIPGMMANLQIIEVAPGLNTTSENIGKVLSFIQELGWQTDQVEDRVGLVKLRVLATLINEAAFALMEGVATAKDIDNAMKLGVNYPRGLLQWADDIGINVITTLLDSLMEEYGQERYRPCVLLKQYMRAGWYGKSAGKGFYTYASEVQ